MPQPTLAASAVKMLSSDGRCKTFDARANGYVRSEAACALVLRRPAAALGGMALCGSSVRIDGRSASLTAPNGSSQRAFLAAALHRAAQAAGAVTGIEAHGTGTPLGDPTEAGALALALCHDDGAPLCLGTAKANVGHSEPASGLLGLAKAAGSLRCGAWLGNAQLRVLNPLVGERLRTARRSALLPTQCAGRLGDAARGLLGVSSFGYSGTIAHAVLDGGVAGRELRASAASWSAGPRYNSRSFPWLPAVTSRSASIRLFSTAWASLASEHADEHADGSRWLLHGTAASAWVDRILLAIVAAPCRAALVHAAALSAELALGKWHGMLVAVAPAAARTAPTVDGLCAIVSAARQLRHRRAW
jgi:acyl transferase domain-containing protein